MPYVIGRPSKRILALATTLGMLVTAAPALADGSGQNGPSWVPPVAAVPASPAASCPTVNAGLLLGPLGDLAPYALVSEANFEGSTSGWSLNNASVVSGNEPWHVAGASDSNSLSIEPGGSAVSPAFCVDNTFPSFRFFAHGPSSGWGTGLVVFARWSLANGMSGQVPVTYLPADEYGSWRATPILPLGSVLSPGQTVSVQFVFSAGPVSAWKIDDVLLDPYAK
ncbi:MAG: hypothetical protein M3010_02435 [Candidatus Dormibacteraeota bacterium]|nr:hypothetical protein [Candidatus Dormibacteraeota bacterium]